MTNSPAADTPPQCRLSHHRARILAISFHLQSERQIAPRYRPMQLHVHGEVHFLTPAVRERESSGRIFPMPDLRPKFEVRPSNCANTISPRVAAGLTAFWSVPRGSHSETTTGLSPISTLCSTTTRSTSIVGVSCRGFFEHGQHTHDILQIRPLLLFRGVRTDAFAALD